MLKYVLGQQGCRALTFALARLSCWLWHTSTVIRLTQFCYAYLCLKRWSTVGMVFLQHKVNSSEQIICELRLKNLLSEKDELLLNCPPKADLTVMTAMQLLFL